MTLEEINKEVEWKEKGRNENSQTIQQWEGERWVTDAKRGGVGHGGVGRWRESLLKTRNEGGG